MKKKEGAIEFTLSSMALMIIAIIILMTMKLNEIDNTKVYVENGLVASNLAAATIDLKRYGINEEIINTNFNKSYNDFCSSLKLNLKLDDNFNPKKNSLISSKVEVDVFKIYNVLNNNDVEVTTLTNEGTKKEKITDGGGKLKTPNGTVIKTTTVYSKIKFNINGFLNKEVYQVSKENSVDVTNQN